MKNIELYIDYNEVINTDVSFLLKYFNNEGHIEIAQRKTSPQEVHYKLLTYLSGKFDNSLILDCGTWHGISSLCLAHNKTNKILSYDVSNFDKYSLVPYQHTPIADDYPNIEYIQSDINNIPDEILKKASLIFLDVVHDCTTETAFTDKLISIGYDGFLLCDDVGLSGVLMFPLDKWFESLPWDKYDLTKVGHFSGTGLLDCGKRGVKIIDK